MHTNRRAHVWFWGAGRVIVHEQTKEMAQKAPSTPLDASGTDIKGHSDEIHDSLMKAYRGDNSVVEDRNRNIKMADAQHLLASYFCVVGVPPTPEQQQHEHHYTHGNDGPENVHAELLHVLTICTENGGGGRVASGDSSQTDKTKNHGAPESVPLVSSSVEISFDGYVHA